MSNVRINAIAPTIFSSSNVEFPGAEYDSYSAPGNSTLELLKIARDGSSAHKHTLLFKEKHLGKEREQLSEILNLRSGR